MTTKQNLTSLDEVIDYFASKQSNLLSNRDARDFHIDFVTMARMQHLALKAIRFTGIWRNDAKY